MSGGFYGEQKFEQLDNNPACAWLNTPLPSLDSTTVADLRLKNPSRFTYKIYLGCWCEDSQRLLPSFIALTREFKIPSKNIRYIALDPDKKSPDKTEEVDQVTLVPTIIVYDGDKEIGRIVEIASPNLESVLLGIL